MSYPSGSEPGRSVVPGSAGGVSDCVGGHHDPPRRADPGLLRWRPGAPVRRRSRSALAGRSPRRPGCRRRGRPSPRHRTRSAAGSCRRRRGARTAAARCRSSAAARGGSGAPPPAPRTFSRASANSSIRVDRLRRGLVGTGTSGLAPVSRPSQIPAGDREPRHPDKPTSSDFGRSSGPFIAPAQRLIRSSSHPSRIACPAGRDAVARPRCRS